MSVLLLPAIPLTSTSSRLFAVHLASAVGDKKGRATVTILDDCGNPAVGYTVTSTFTGDFNEQQSADTNGSGVAVIETVGTARGGISFQFCVDTVAGGLPYDSNDNLVTCCND